MKTNYLLASGIVACLMIAAGFFGVFAGPTAGAGFALHKAIVLGLLVAGYALLLLSAYALSRPPSRPRID